MSTQTDVVSSAKWSAKQERFLESRTRYIDVEGALRSGKSVALIRKVQNLCLDYPGIKILLCRYTQDALDAQLSPLFYQMVPKEILGEWNSDEEYRVVGDGSWVYLRALKSSETQARYSKFAGLTLGAVAVDQAEEVPADYWEVLKGRCSQVGTPMQRLLVANPPGQTHWLAKEFSDDQTRMPPNHELIRMSVYDNAQNLPPEYIPDLEQQYPSGHPLRRRFIEGERGIGYLGEPIYGGVFRRELHIRAEEMNPELPLLEAWDFGRAAVLWAQFPLGRRVYLAELLGEPGEYLETFVPKALDLRGRLFPNPLDVWSCCDPAGADRTSHGTALTAVRVLAEHGVNARWVTGANHPERRSYAIQQIAGAMSRRTPQGEAYVVHPRCQNLIDGCEAGYVKDGGATGLTASPSVIRPKKDGTYDHLMNCKEYLELNFGTGQTRRDQEKDMHRRLRESQRDFDPFDQRKRQIKVGRGGY